MSIFPDWLGVRQVDEIDVDRYISDKPVALKVKTNLIQFRLKNVDLKFKAQSISIDFNKEYKKTILKKKQVNIVFKVERVIT